MADLIGLVEAAYRFDLPEAEWLAGVASAGGQLFDRGLGSVAFVYAFDRDGEPVISNLMFHGNFDPGWLIRHRLRLGMVPDALHDVPCEWRKWMHLSCGTVSQIKGVKALRDAVTEFGGARDVVAINGRDPQDFGLWLGAPLPRVRTLAAGQRGLYSRISAHLASGYRVRRALARSASLREAVLSSDGVVLHAEGPARSKQARDQLRGAAVRIDQARSRRGRRDPERATSDWKGLVDCRWTLLDEFESDGKRFVVAARNDVSLNRPVPLSARERQVLAFAAMEHSNKEIAYELGLSAATVRVLMMRAASKLGVRGRSEALARFRELGG